MIVEAIVAVVTGSRPGVQAVVVAKIDAIVAVEAVEAVVAVEAGVGGERGDPQAGDGAEVIRDSLGGEAGRGRGDCLREENK